MKRSLQFFVGLFCLFAPRVLQAQTWPNPEVLYYKMNGVGTSIPNDALSPPAGTATATIQGAITQGGTGKCGGGLIGSGVTSTTDFLNTGWATNLSSTASWTISFYSANFGSTAALYYIFGDLNASSFRCFTNGVAGPNNWILRGTGLTDVLVTGGATVAPHHIAFVYDASLANIQAYLDGVLVNTVAQGAFTLSSTGPFKVMGYSANIGAPVGGVLDEFRLYSRALTATEVAGIHGAANVTVNATSTPSPANVCAGNQLTLTGTGNASSYSWSDGVNPYPDNTAFMPTISGAYVVTATDGAGCTATSSLTVTVNALPNVTASANPGTTICGNSPVTLQGGGANTYTWNGIPTLGSDTVLNPATAGTYTVVGVDANNCSASSNVTLNVANLPIAPNVIVCPGSALVELSASVVQNFSGNLSPASPTWNRPVAATPPSLLSGVGTSVYYATHTFTVPVTGNYTITSLINSPFDGFGVLYQNSFNPLTPIVNAITASDDVIGDEPEITAVLTAGTTYIYVHTTFDNGETGAYQMQMTATPSSPVLWFTQASGGVSVDGSNPFNPINDLEVLASGGVYANLTSSSAAGSYDFWVADASSPDCRTQMTLTISPAFAVTASASATPICMGSSTTLNASGATTYTWMPGSLSGSPAVMPLVNTTYTVTGTDGAGCTATNTVDVVVNPASLNTPTVVDDSTCAPGGVVNLSATGTVVNWYDALTGGTLVNTGNNFSPNISNTETYYVDNSDQTLVGPFAVTMPAQTGTFTGNVRGYFFIAPNDFVITSLFVPTTASSGTQNIAVVKFNNNVPPPLFSATTNAFTVEFLTQNNPTAGYIPVNIPVLAGEVIGILGTRSTVNSYSNTGNTITINGSTVTLSRLGMQFPLTTTAPQDLWTEAAGSISRIEFEYSNSTTGCPSYPRVPVVGTVNPLPNVTANITPTTTCANTSAIPSGAGALTYTWDAGLIDGQAFIVSTGNTTYTVTGTDANGCTATSTATVSASASSGLLATATSSQLQNQGDDMNLSYYDASCNLIASVDDGALGNILGLTSAAVNVDATAGSHNGQPFVRRWYEITPASNGSADVVLYVNQSDFDDYNAIVLPPYLPMPTSGSNADPNIPNIRITKNDNTGLGNNPVVITPSVNWNGQYWELSFNTSSFSQFRIHSANQFNAPLPVSLVKFEGQKLNTSDLLTWVTSAEQNNAYFNLQYSRDAKSFETIAQVTSKAPGGNSQMNLSYAYEHLKPQAGHNYYRLEQVDLNGQRSTQSKVLDLIRTGAGSIVQLYPNPVQQTLNIEWYAEKSVVSAVKVFDMSGRMVQQIQANLQSGVNTLTMNFSALASGIYTVQLFEDDHLSFVEQVRKTQ